MCREQASQSSPALENGVVLTASDRQVAVGVLQDLDCFVANFEKFCDQIALLPDISLMRVGTPLFQGSISGIWVEDEEGIDERDQRAQYSQTKEQPRFHVRDRERRSLQAHEHLATGIGN